MILSEDQHQGTLEWIARFRRELDQIRSQLDAGEGEEPTQMLRRAYAGGYRRMLDKLGAEVAEYEALRSGQKKSQPIDSLADLPRALSKARIAAGLTQRELAERLEIDEDEFSLYEQNEYDAAPLSTLINVADALGLRFGIEVALPVHAHQAA